MLKGILFDLDDTLFDHRHSSRSALASLQNKYDCFSRLTLDEFEKEHLTLLEEIHLNQVLTGEYSIEEARAERFRRMFKKFGNNDYDTLAYESAEHYRDVYQDSRRLITGAVELLRKFHGKLKIAIVSNNLLDEQIGKLKHLGIDKFFDAIVVSEEVGVTKPDPLIFQTALDRISCAANEVIMVGDKWNVDIIGATNLGIKSIWLNIFDVPCPDENLAPEVKTLEEVNEIISDIYF
jgi:YjjG family noncanonical pyrimidine nucleotidase